MQEGRGKHAEPVTRKPSAPQAAAPRVRSGRFTLLLLLGLAAAVLAADLWTKHLVGRALASDSSVGAIRVIPGCLDFRWSENRGAVFGMGQGKGAFFIAFTLIATVAILWVGLAHGRRSLLLTFGLGVLLGGALGNLYDRIFYSHVRDFIYAYLGTHVWPTFNVADIAICTGAGLIILYSFRYPSET